jgi:hypothetical protein
LQAVIPLLLTFVFLKIIQIFPTFIPHYHNQDGQRGEAIAQYPYKLYEFSDISLSFAFNGRGDYAVTLQTRIIGDPKYEAAPLEATLDLSVVSPFQAMLAGMLSNRLILLTIILVPVVGGGALLCMYIRLEKNVTAECKANTFFPSLID